MTDDSHAEENGAGHGDAYGAEGGPGEAIVAGVTGKEVASAGEPEAGERAGGGESSGSGGLVCDQ